LRRASSDQASWDERAGRLFAELEMPSKAMVRRAYRGAFDDHELDDVYNGAWVGTLRALATRHTQLTDQEIRSYVFTAVAHQAGKEIRRRKRRPTTSLDLASAVADVSPAPDARAGQAEDSRVTRDLLASLPKRRRAVLMLRYGWGLDPAQVCELVKGLSPRAYRKEITRGVDELTEKLRCFESGDWCADREPILKAYAAGLADSEQQLQAQQHLSHCRSCSEFVGRLSGHLHDVGSALAVPGAVDAVGGDRIELADRVGDLADRVREPLASLVGRGGSHVAEPAGQISSSGGLKGAGAAAAGVAAKLAGLGTAGKIAIACIGGGAAATVCVAVGVVRFGSVGDDPGRQVQAVSSRAGSGADSRNVAKLLAGEAVPAQPGPEPRSHRSRRSAPPASTTSPQHIPPPDPGAGSRWPRRWRETGHVRLLEPQPEPEPAPSEPVTPTAPPGEQDLGLAPAPATAPAPSAIRGQRRSSRIGS
jgi:RNA polymerase sigma factor (sigma-70 family)